jgi:hypothetical protein
MIESLITNKTRLKLLFKFFLNEKTTSYLRDLEQEFGESTNAIRIELNRFVEARMLTSAFKGNKKYYKANTSHPLYRDINSILQKVVGLDQVIDKVLMRVGGLQKAFLIGDLAQGKESNIIDLLLVGDNINTEFIVSLTNETEKIISKKIRFLVLSTSEKDDYYKKDTALLLWKNK